MHIKGRRSIRLQGYDYAQEGAYYITLCTHDRLCLFGEVHNRKMGLNEYGKIVEQEWLQTEKIRDNVKMGEYIIMPNHIHGIIIINNRRGVSNTPDISNKNEPLVGGSIPPLHGPSNNLGAIIRGYKSAVTKWFRKNTDIQDVWQRNYYEHIIRDGNDYDRISNYIIDNPINWVNDEHNNL